MTGDCSESVKMRRAGVRAEGESMLCSGCEVLMMEAGARSKSELDARSPAWQVRARLSH